MSQLQHHLQAIVRNWSQHELSANHKRSSAAQHLFDDAKTEHAISNQYSTYDLVAVRNIPKLRYRDGASLKPLDQG